MPTTPGRQGAIAKDGPKRVKATRAVASKTSESDRFVQIAREAIEFRDRLRDAVEPRLPPSTSARSFARLLGLDKSFGWALYRVMNATDAAGVMGAMPGRRGIRILREGLHAARCEASRVEATIGALERLHERVGDRNRPTADLLAMAAGRLDSADSMRSLARLQRQGFEMASRLRGAAIDLRVVAMLITPSAREDYGDWSAVTIQHRIRRLRPGGIIHAYTPTETARAKSDFDVPGPWDAADGRGDEHANPTLVRAASSPDLDEAELGLIRRPGKLPSVVADPSSERTSPLTLAFAESMQEAGPIRRTSGPSDTCQFWLPLTVPTGRVIFDLWMERSLPPIDPQAGIYLHSRPVELPPEMLELTRFPSQIEFKPIRRHRLPAEFEDAEGSYRHLLSEAWDRHGAAESDFRVLRLGVAYPPVPASLLVRWRLPA
ncbi:MAG: hypothetical protein ACO3P9_12830 [Phycisphaerales bacterium]